MLSLLFVTAALAQDADTDRDGLSDLYEATTSLTDPEDDDSDNDGLYYHQCQAQLRR